MRPVNTILDRFRRAAAVPAAAGDELDAELATLFVSLDEIEEEREKLRTEAAGAAEKRLASARAEAALIVAKAREEAAGARARTEAEAREAASRESEELVERAEAEARRIAEAGADRIPVLAADVAACVKEGSA